MTSCTAPPNLSFLTAEQANAIDVELMSTLGFSIDQLMELAGLSVATSLSSEFSLAHHPRILIICGPGNNGGDGLVAARHLHHFGYTVTVCYPKRTPKPLYEGLVTQLEALKINILAALPDNVDASFDVVLDAIFGFSFRGDVRPPFDTILRNLSACSTPIASVDIPSGWNVDTGPPQSGAPVLHPHMLISLTAPKLCAKLFQGVHYLGGRFVPPQIAETYQLALPKYPSSSMHVKISDGGTSLTNLCVIEASGTYMQDPYELFKAWYNEAIDAGLKDPGGMTVSTADPATGKPTSRVVLMKDFNQQGLTFYTNYNSPKSTDLEANPLVAVNFWWPSLSRQVRVEGSVEKVSADESDEYFRSRPRGSRLGAHASAQSEVIVNRTMLEDKWRHVHERYGDAEDVPVPRPAHWGGWRITPSSIEFWEGGTFRLNDRIKYVREGDGWSRTRLQP